MMKISQTLLDCIIIFVTFYLQLERYVVANDPTFLDFQSGIPHVTLKLGLKISGTVKFSRNARPYTAFIGIPYGKVPERFQEPQPITESAWQGILNCTKPGPVCPQMQYDDLSKPGIGEEDCLFLNVYSPVISQNDVKTGSGYLPTMVWIHGGGFMFGSGSDYDPKYFMDEHVVIVTMSYRLGCFGFLSTGDNVIPGNNGLKDIVVGLRWVQDNIKLFNGDNGKVTIFGLSAGAAAVHHLMLSEKGNGLFHGAISQSGSVLSGWGYHANPRQVAAELAEYLKCPKNSEVITSEEIFNCLKGFSTQKLNKAQVYFKKDWPSMLIPMVFNPTVEPENFVSDLTPFQTEPPISILTGNGKNLPDVPWLVGATENELAATGEYFLKNAKLLKKLNTDWENTAPKVLEFEKYFKEDDEKIGGILNVAEKIRGFYFAKRNISEENKVELGNMFGDEFSFYGVYRSALEMAKKGGKREVYFYQYAYNGPVHYMAMVYQMSGKNVDKIGHADDLQHLFPFEAMIPGLDQVIKPNTTDEKFSQNLVRLWVSFAKNGKPTHSWGNATNKTWSPLSKNILNREQPLQWYKINEYPEMSDVSQNVKDRIKFWDDLWKNYFTPAIIKSHREMNQ